MALGPIEYMQLVASLMITLTLRAPSSLILIEILRVIAIAAFQSARVDRRAREEL